MTSRDTEIAAVIEDLLDGRPDVVRGKMFGLPGFYTNGKLFACVYDGGVGLKVPEALANALLARRDASPFQPYGKSKMREWVLLERRAPADYAADAELFQTSIEFVSATPRKPRRKRSPRPPRRA